MPRRKSRAMAPRAHDLMDVDEEMLTHRGKLNNPPDSEVFFKHAVIFLAKKTLIKLV